MLEDGWLIGDGMATVLYDAPALERIHATLAAALRAATAQRLTPRLGDNPVKRQGAPVQVPVTVQPPTGRFTACAVRT